MDVKQASASATQLADARPKIDRPLRVQIPLALNAPVRAEPVPRDKRIAQVAFSPSAFRNTKEVTMPILATMKPNTKLPPIPQSVDPFTSSSMEHDAQIKTAIRDYSVLAFSSKRAGKTDVEASAYVALAVIQDNQGNYAAGNGYYKQYMELCHEMKDQVGVGIASNCIGVNYMMLAVPSTSDQGCLQANESVELNLEYLNKAIEFHRAHLQVADAGGQFVAHSNLGLCFGMLRDWAQAGQHHQEALRIAIKLQTLYGQSIAVGNLGLLALTKGDTQTAKTCLEQHLQLVQTLQDVEAEVNAWEMLATAASMQSGPAAGLEFLEHARRVARSESFPSELRRIHCLVGVARGSASMRSHMQSIASAAAAHAKTAASS